MALLLLVGLSTGPAAAQRADLAPWLKPSQPLWSLRRDTLRHPPLAAARFHGDNPSRSTATRLGGLPIEETLLSWDEEGRLAGVRLVAVSRGDTRSLSLDAQDRVRDACAALAREWADGAEGTKEEERLQHAEITRRRWTLEDRDIVLTWAVTRRHLRRQTGTWVDRRAEFVRLDLLPRTPPDPPAAMRPAPGVGRISFADRVAQQPNGDVVIGGVPMVDQGQRGYCAAATIARMLGYYGMDVDQHEIAQLVHASPTAGTNADEMMNVLRRAGGQLGITARQHVATDLAAVQRLVAQYNRLARRARQPTLETGRVIHVAALFNAMNGDLLTRSRAQLRGDYQRFLGAVRRNIDEGIPLAWSMVLGRVPESGRTPQTAGGHMRLIIGYNDRTEELIFSDSWGRGHDAKRIRTDHAWAVTLGLYTIEPR